MMITVQLSMFSMWTSVFRVRPQGCSWITSGCSWIIRHPLTMILILLLTCATMSHGSSCGDITKTSETPKDGACGDLDIRNSVKNFRFLENCTVIEGSLHISIIDYVPQEEYDKYSFPLLREITGHLMMNRMFGLRSLRNLFPNLAVIRGQTKFFKDFAFVVYEMRDLEELGLLGLTMINGLVRVTRNHRLCHISTIDWGKITPNVDPSRHLFVENREELLCPEFCDESCPSSTYQDINQKRCWSPKPDDCQRNLECNCANGRPCAPDGSCCHDLCLGGCSGINATDCHVCTHVVYRNECLLQCPPHTYMLSNRRCLTKDECLNLQSRTERGNRSDSSENFPKLLVGNGTIPNQCVFKCPPGYMVKEKDLHIPECIRCQGICPKVCNTTIVSSIQDSEVLFGCSKINGSLEIQITGGSDIDYILTKNLEAIREVTGYIRIWRTYALLTLHFFRNLQIIGGEKLVHKEYSLFVADNANLQELFPQHQMTQMIIQKGKIGFHNNRKLCVAKISNFIQQLNNTSQLENKRIDVSNTSNGNLIACKSITLELNLAFIDPTLVVYWHKYQSSDSRQLINYVINYKAVSTPVMDIFQGRDACSDNEWQTQVVKPSLEPWKPNDTVLFETSLVPGLKYFTKYAIYVQATTLHSATVSAMTNITYFLTSSSRPTEPMDLQVSSPDAHELTVRWNPPKTPNGNVTHYKVFYQPQSSSINGFEQRDFCKDPIVSIKAVQKEKEKLEEEKKTKKQTNPESDSGANCCTCPISEEELLKQHRLRELEIAFENDLHNSIYTKRWDPNCVKDLDFQPSKLPNIKRRRRNINNSRIGQDFNNPVVFHYRPNERDPSRNGSSVFTGDNRTNSSMTEAPGSNLRQEVIVYDTMVTLSNLEHFVSYNIEVVACHETDPVTGIKLCGSSAIITGQTAADPHANDLNSSLVVLEPMVSSNKSLAVLVRWQPPLMPNGLILKYSIKYKKVDADRDDIMCVSARQFQNNSNSYLLHLRQPGNYSLQISAHSIAGNGTNTPELFFSISFPHESEVESNVRIIGISAGLVIAFLIVFGIVIYFVYRNRYIKADVIVSQNPHYIPTDQLYAPDEWEVPRDSIRLIKELGQGSFGTVFEGLMENPETKVSTPVAIKTVNDKADFHERLKILKEATTMKVFECHHVVKLLGVVSKGQPALVIMELMALGDLRNYLRKCRPDEDNYPDFRPPTLTQIHQMAGEIADGMAYLADKKIVHRDLAARNCLVSHDGTVKIADFGMARDVYMTEYYRKDQKALLPIRWMAPESLSDGIYTTMSDIWSFGIVLWEMVTLAEQPYQGLGNDEVLQFVTGGCFMRPPNGCPEDLYDLMKKCWAYNPKHRPTFRSILEILDRYLSDHFHGVSYYYNEVAKKNKEDGKAESTYEGDLEAVGIELERLDVDEASGTDREFDDEDCVMIGESQHLHDDGNGDNAMERNDDRDCAERLDNLPHLCGSYNSKKEHSPLMLQEQNVQEQLLYPLSASAGRMHGSGDLFSVDDDDDDDDNDSDSDFTRKDKKYIRSSKDARSSSSERLKLLSDSPDSSRPKLELLLPAKPSQCAVKLGACDYASTLPGAISPQVCDEFPSPAPVSSHLSIPSAAVASPPPFSLAHVLPAVVPSTSPILHVDMEGIGNSRRLNPKQSTVVSMTEHEGDYNKPLWQLQNNNPSNKSSAISSRAKLSDSSSSSNSNSNTNSIHSSSDGSKESSSSCGSHNRFTSATANGHGPYTHQHTALC